MKVVHINTSTIAGGAAKACYRLHTALMACGINSSVVTVNDTNNKFNVVKYRTSVIQKFKNNITFLVEAIAVKLLVKSNSVPFSFGVAGVDISSVDAIKKADVLHIHWVNNGMLSISSVLKLCAMGKKMVWTFHDSWAATGGCHVKAGCTNYLAQCTSCPVINYTFLNNIPPYLFTQKLQLFTHPIHIITPSQWLMAVIKKSLITANNHSQNIPNTLPIEVFAPQPITRNTTFNILLGYMKINASGHKGLGYAVDAIRLFITNNPSVKVQIAVFGGGAADVTSINLPHVTALGFVSDEAQMATIYNNANVYIAPYLEDNFPNTVLEALSCGTPVVAFDAGGVPQLVQHQLNGYLAASKDVNGLAQGIQWVHNYPNYTLLRNTARNYVLANFNPATIAQRHVEYYQSI